MKMTLLLSLIFLASTTFAGTGDIGGNNPDPGARPSYDKKNQFERVREQMNSNANQGKKDNGIVERKR